jgi:hypothetical protein
MERITKYIKCMMCDGVNVRHETNTQPPYDERAFCSECGHTEIRYVFGALIFNSTIIPINSLVVTTFEEYINSDEELIRTKMFMETLQTQEIKEEE